MGFKLIVNLYFKLVCNKRFSMESVDDQSANDVIGIRMPNNFTSPDFGATLAMKSKDTHVFGLPCALRQNKTTY